MKQLWVDELSYRSLLALWVLAIIVFAGIYFGLSYVPGNGPTTLDSISDPFTRFLDALYFSVITGATVGYGDILPVGASRFFAALEGILSFILLAVFVSRFSTRKNDAALQHIHTMSADTAFNDIRHGLFIARKDLDTLIKIVQAEKSLTPKNWKNLRTALRQMRIYIRKIAEVRDTKHHRFLDSDHEHLLLDSVERCMRRADETLDALFAVGLTCTSDNDCLSEIQNVIKATEDEFVKQHVDEVNDENKDLYQEVLVQLNELRNHV